jgi:hypothetical protein
MPPSCALPHTPPHPHTCVSSGMASITVCLTPRGLFSPMAVSMNSTSLPWAIHIWIRVFWKLRTSVHTASST